jgi:hypothetical protein
MHDIKVKFQNQPEIFIRLRNSAIADKYKQLVADCLLKEQPIFRDPNRYTHAYLQELAIQAKELLGWDWLSDTYTIEQTVRMHKDLEEFLAQGFSNIPSEYDNLVHELHFCLHKIEGGEGKRGQWLQVEWFNDEGFDIMPGEVDFRLGLGFGDIRLQNPYVGHSPMMMFLQNDYSNFRQTCRFHDLARPGFNIVIEPWTAPGTLNLHNYMQWFKKNAPDFVKEHGMEKILEFTGHPIIGNVVNLDVLAEVCKQPLLELESVTVN